MTFWKRLFRPVASPTPARAEDIVGPEHVGAWVDKEAAGDLLELPRMLLALTHGELGDVKVTRSVVSPTDEEEDDEHFLELRSQRGVWRIPIERRAERVPSYAPGGGEERVLVDEVYMVDIAKGINRALLDVGAKGWLYDLLEGGFVYASAEQADRLAQLGLLAAVRDSFRGDTPHPGPPVG
jgi:hypothetical protein